ncbi:MAG: bifunctional phosphoribosyl-AMP cyclohydrolase/phosphoribosyl-ATP diphosphatase HisIE [bacterium]|nr:bifunctional phosphoribosyl-AMP cyclohydrolase/phosphoribosyl-ATP diphosphatase HisIE [bacterium]
MTIDLTQLKFDSDGLIPAIVQDADNGEVLMMAWMNGDAVKKTAETGLTHFFSRSRQKLWQKGESSGHVQTVTGILFDCDADCLLVKARQEVAACHMGHRSCFYRNLLGEVVGEAVFDAGEVYGDKESREIFDRLFGVVMDRKKNPSEGSYTAKLLAGGPGAIGGKVIEEAGELVGAAAGGVREEVIHETADLIYHTWVLLAGAGVSPQDVREELAKRFGTSGLEEKKQRT